MQERKDGHPEANPGYAVCRDREGSHNPLLAVLAAAAAKLRMTVSR